MITRFSIVMLGFMSVTLSTCGLRSSSSEDTGGSAAVSFSGNRQDVTGSLTSQTGSQSQMQGWVVALIERDSGTARVSEATSGGVLSFSKLSLAATHTAILLSPDYLLQAVLSMPSSTANTVKQYFQLSSTSLPRLVQKGGVINFQSTETLAIQSEMAADSNADGIPDGVSSLSLTDASTDNLLVRSVAFNLADTDKDGQTNESDADIDGDGLINAIDSDDDGDGIIDLVDSDANGDGTADIQQTATDQYYKVGFEYIAVQYETTSSSSTLKFVAKVRDGVAPKSVKIRGASSFMTGATYTPTGGSLATWDYSLADDGLNNDSAAADSLYARSVTLASGVAPRSNQVVFFQVTMGEGTEQFTAEYPYVFPNLTATVPTTTYSTTTRTVTLSGDPFGSSLQDFVWVVTVTNSAGVRVYESNAVSGTTRTVTLPANIMVSGNTYTYKATAQLLDKVPGYPGMVVSSDSGTIDY